MLQAIASLARTISKLGIVLLVLLTLAAGGVAPRQPALATPTIQAVAVSFQKIADVTTVEGSNPVAIANAGDGSGRLFIVEQPGRITIYDGAQLRATPFLDITSLVNSGDREQGLLGLAFDPDFATNGFFYVNYTSHNGGAGDTVVARYHVPNGTPNDADEGSALPLLTIGQPQTNHNGGQLQFGPDGYLYISTGDGGNGGDTGPGHNSAIGNAQDLNSLLGKILRIDVSHSSPTNLYAIPPGNPFANDGNSNTRGEIWAYGLRNPWRFSFDRQTGDMLIGDVGQEAREEIDFQPAGTGGRNYGWRCREGDQSYTSDSHCSSETFTEPILVYDHGGNKCAVMGGYRYRGARHPQLRGVYFYADNCTGEMWQATGSGANWTASAPIDTSHAISTFGEDETGELYFADRDSGEIYRITANSKFVNLPLVRR